jgi:hypothetical protein
VATVRYQIELDEEQMAELERLRVLGGLRTKKDLWNTALTLLKWAATRKSEGWSIVCVNDRGTEKELSMPYLDAVAANSQEPQTELSAPHPIGEGRHSSMRIADVG